MPSMPIPSSAALTAIPPLSPAIKDGTLGMDIAQLGYDMGYKAVEAAVKALEGEQLYSFIDSGSKVVDSTNCDEYIDDMKTKGLWE